MNEVIDIGLIQKDRLKDIMREILSLEHERNAVKEDMVDVKNHISSFLPKGMFSKALKVYLEKGYDGQAQADYEYLSDLLGIPFACKMYRPREMTDLSEDQKQNIEKVKELFANYDRLLNERNTISCDIRDIYIQAKNIGVSVPLLKKAIDFCLHPSKLEAYQDSIPLLDTYVDISKEVD